MNRASRRLSLPSLLLALGLLAGCANKPQRPAQPVATDRPAPASSAARGARPDLPGEYTAGGLYKPGVNDSGPANAPDISALREPEPRDEPRARYGNRSPYTVLGKTYHVMDSAAGYVERGIASWYGEKFHGRATSSFEPYDMYAFSAAHKSLPLPSFARVTNLENGRSVVVRVNDRGPFHDNRLIDLSYAAAIRLGIHVTGTAPVEVRSLSDGSRAAAEPPLPRTVSSVSASPLVRRDVDADTWLQVASFADKDNARSLLKRLKAAELGRVKIRRATVRGERVYRVRLGPVSGRAQAERLAARVQALGLGRPTLVSQ